MSTDKKFRKLESEFNQRVPYTSLGYRGHHLARSEEGVGRHHKAFVNVERNKVRQAPYIPSAQNGLHWKKGKLVARGTP